MTFLLKFRVFWLLKFPNSHEICGHINIFWSKTMYHDIVLLKLNDSEPKTLIIEVGGWGGGGVWYY